MLTEKRFALITALVNEKRIATTQELMEMLGVSESTVRRDLSALDSMGKLHKVHGGAIAANSVYKMHDDDVEERRIVNTEEKIKIGMYAAALIQADDFVYIDAGTTTEFMLDYIAEKKAVYVTNAVEHAKKLASKGFEVYLIGGRLKGSTEAAVGAEAIEALSKYNFTKGFWGTNGVHKNSGFTTPDREEAGVKRAAAQQCKNRYVLADSSKFDSVSPVSFAQLDDMIIITDSIPEGYEENRNIIKV